MLEIKKVAVLGSGVMGSGIAAHLANAGISSLMLDIVPDKLTSDEEKRGLKLNDLSVRNRFANLGLQNALKSNPAAFFVPKGAALVTTGNFEDDWSKLAECDWIIEVVVERLDIKKQVFKRVAEIARPDAIISSNTSGISIRAMAEDLPLEFQKRFMVTHFFNPVRYMKLLEIVPHPNSNPLLIEFVRRFGEDTLGKGVIICKDTPNFIGNRIGIYGMMSTLKRMSQNNLRVEEVDAILGRASGRPKSAAFRTSDLVGLDTSLHVARNVYDNAPDDPERNLFLIPDWVQQMADKRWLGDKTGQGFYKKVKDEKGKSAILSLNSQTLEYEPQLETPLADTKLAEAARRSDPRKRLETLAYLDDRAGKFGWAALADTLLYTAKIAPQIADDIQTIDQAMKWGYNWDLGIFESWDAIGPLKSIQKMRAEGREIPQWLVDFTNRGQDYFYIEQNGRKHMWDFKEGRYVAAPERTDLISLARLKKDKANILRSNDSASLIDLGDGVLCLEFTSKMNTIDAEMAQLGMWSLTKLNNDSKWKGLVIGNEGSDFCAGANLFLVVMGANSGEFGQIEQAVKATQDWCMAIKYSQKPVVVAPFGRTLGGGCEITMAGARVRAYAETYIGQVEVGPGLIPGAGGNKELLIRNIERMRGMGGTFPLVQKTFEAISYAKVSTSAEDARSIGFLRKTDRITLNKERLISDAKADVLELANQEGGYKPPQPFSFKLPGEGGYLAGEQLIEGLEMTKAISEHDGVIARKLLHVLTGGSEASPVREVSEQYLLDLEREAFIELCKLPKTQGRMQHILMKGKPLRN
ncbi:3-hydroxyacyl-CoA dehydrogenase/enoyl-CoA hydratase family protein [Candidatus Chlorohelix sp.]|uniref:3-hydroxyacyl-CoA dehydrogenase/enoyl-CoA hydratase family protein n=1 Tax=Candidatus Chlorohelix sp. TaxID=3139201 RepID=UPI0030750AA9